MSDTRFWEAIRQALLAIVDAIERYILASDLTTAEMRRQYKRGAKLN
jgi:hypothetical protein